MMCVQSACFKIYAGVKSCKFATEQSPVVSVKAVTVVQPPIETDAAKAGCV